MEIHVRRRQRVRRVRSLDDDFQIEASSLIHLILNVAQDGCITNFTRRIKRPSDGLQLRAQLPNSVGPLCRSGLRDQSRPCVQLVKSRRPQPRSPLHRYVRMHALPPRHVWRHHGSPVGESPFRQQGPTLAINHDFMVQQPPVARNAGTEKEHSNELTSSEDLNDRMHRWECRFCIF
jgi:hypothetical protein